MLIKPSQSVDAPRQLNEMNTASLIEGELELLNLQEVAQLLRLAPISIYRMVAKRLIPVYRISRRMRFNKKDVMEYLERSKSERLEPDSYGPKG